VRRTHIRFGIVSIFCLIFAHSSHDLYFRLCSWYPCFVWCQRARTRISLIDHFSHYHIRLGCLVYVYVCCTR
jgi:hypothetical protein